MEMQSSYKKRKGKKKKEKGKSKKKKKIPLDKLKSTRKLDLQKICKKLFTWHVWNYPLSQQLFQINQAPTFFYIIQQKYNMLSDQVQPLAKPTIFGTKIPRRKKCDAVGASIWIPSRLEEMITKFLSIYSLLLRLSIIFLVWNCWHNQAQAWKQKQYS